MQGTFTLPSGRRVRCSSQRRYVLVRDVEPPQILKRSDSLDTIRNQASRYGSSVIVDTIDRAAVSPPDECWHEGDHPGLTCEEYSLVRFGY